ncbi:MAG TPA: hypothetical protein VFI30_07025 [Nocardioidaceae bacterium]|nr:hypothetical protein [Nocardioidaceae bacterium]
MPLAEPLAGFGGGPSEVCADYPWTATHVLDPDNPLPDQIVPGGWGQLELVVLDGFITDEDYDVVVARVTR